MPKLTADALDFSRIHIRQFYDSDFFPKPLEFDALWHSWDEVIGYLTADEIGTYSVSAPKAYAAPKPNGTFRIVHQLDPLNSLTYTAMAYMVAEELESIRFPVDENVACSYRITLSHQKGEFFADGQGYDKFIERCTELSQTYSHVLTVDIADFYNQIYVHRLENVISLCTPVGNKISKDLESFLLALNGTVSKGIPVGPAASILMAEAIMVDVDQFLAGYGVAHTRYVDDIRIFHNSRHELIKLLERLSLYLYGTHRLTVAASKTKIISSADFIKEYLNNPEEVEKQRLHEMLASLESKHSGYAEASFINIDNETTGNLETRKVVVADLLKEILSRDSLDLGLARHLLRRCKKNRLRSISPDLIKHFDFFAPVIRDVVLYLNKVSNSRFVQDYSDSFGNLVENSEAAGLPFVRYWLERYFAENPGYLADMRIRRYVMENGDICNQAIAATKSKNVSWVRHMRTQIDTLGPWEKRAVIIASQILAKQERMSWLGNLEQQAQSNLERWVIRWVRALA
jgi:Reverse transcriptase (RNA-dependent DNA polymerase)